MQCRKLIPKLNQKLVKDHNRLNIIPIMRKYDTGFFVSIYITFLILSLVALAFLILLYFENQLLELFSQIQPPLSKP